FQDGAEDLRTHPLPFSQRHAELGARTATLRSNGRDAGGRQRLERNVRVVGQPSGAEKPPFRWTHVYDLPQVARVVVPVPFEATVLPLSHPPHRPLPPPSQ